MKGRFFITSGIILLFMAGCKMTGTVQIEVIKPAKVTLPEPVKSLVIINNYKAGNNNKTTDEIQNAYETLDTLTSQFIIEQLSSYLNESPRLDTCLVQKRLFYRKAEDILKPVNKNHVALICENYKTDALLSLEGFGITDSIERFSVMVENGYYSQSSYLALYIKSVWRFYTQDTLNPNPERWFERDTIYLSEVQTYKEFFNALITDDGRQWLAQEMSNKVSQKLSDKMVPFWQTEERVFFYSNNSMMKIAANYAYNDEWLKVAAIWQGLVQDENKWLSGAACHNMALACEVQGKLDLAKVWAAKTLQKYNNSITINYLRILDRRIKEEDVLNQQFWLQHE